MSQAPTVDQVVQTLRLAISAAGVADIEPVIEAEGEEWVVALGSSGIYLAPGDFLVAGKGLLRRSAETISGISVCATACTPSTRLRPADADELVIATLPAVQVGEACAIAITSVVRDRIAVVLQTAALVDAYEEASQLASGMPTP